jgi:hypothetical protein
MHYVQTIEILILFVLYSDLFSMHGPHHNVFPDVHIIYAGAFAEFDLDDIRNVIGV